MTADFSCQPYMYPSRLFMEKSAAIRYKILYLLYFLHRVTSQSNTKFLKHLVINFTEHNSTMNLATFKLR